MLFSYLIANCPWLTLQEVRAFSTTADVERFLLVHGEHIVDVLGSEVDRIESNIKVSGQIFYVRFGVIRYYFLYRNMRLKLDI